LGELGRYAHCQTHRLDAIRSDEPMRLLATEADLVVNAKVCPIMVSASKSFMW